MLRSKQEGKTTLLKYLQQLRSDSKPTALRPLLAKVYVNPEKALAEHLNGLTSSKE
jgi:hypothetical protein